MKANNFSRFLIVLLALAPFLALAQQAVPSQSRVLVAPAAKEIPVMKVRATARRPSRSSKASPLAIGDQMSRSSGASSAAAGTTIQSSREPELTHLKLTPRDHYHGLGKLSYHKPQYVSAELNRVEFVAISEPELAFVYAKLEVKKDQRYLVDFSVSTNHNVNFTMQVSGASQGYGVGKGDHHLLAYLEPLEDGEVSVAIFNDKAVYKFYSLEVTRID